MELEQVPCEQFLQRFEIYRAFLRAKQVGEKRGKFQNDGEIVHKVVVLILITLYSNVSNKRTVLNKRSLE